MANIIRIILYISAIGTIIVIADQHTVFSPGETFGLGLSFGVLAMMFWEISISIRTIAEKLREQ